MQMTEMSTGKQAMFKPGTVLDGKWIIMELIGRGAMGEVYRAHQSNLKRDVAIKVISEDVLSELADDPEELEVAFSRFEREVQTMAQVRHTNILNIYDYGETYEGGSQKSSRTAFIVMELIPGNSLRFTMADDGLDDVPDEYGQWVEKYFLPILDGVEVLHNNGIVHRDLKPENIFMDGEVPKIADFGLARSHRLKAVTVSIEMLGTLAYMSPEQSADFKNAGFTADIYALGKILFEAVNGTLTEKTLPFTSVAIENPETDFLAEINKVIAKATSVTASERYQTVSELRSDLLKSLSACNAGQQQKQQWETGALPGERIGGGRRRSLAVVFAVATVIVGVTGAYYFGRNLGSPGGLEESSYTNHDGILTNQQTYAVDGDQKLPKTITGRDGSMMVLTGDLDNGLESSAFYIDEQKVTNFMFVEFLNSIKNTLTVNDDVVRQGDTIIGYISSDPQDGEEIIYKHDTFHLKDQARGDRPAVRVTFHGAHLYAAHYGKELLTVKEWEFAYRYHLLGASPDSPGDDRASAENSSGMMHNPIKGSPSKSEEGALQDMGKEVKEWVNVTLGPVNNNESNREHDFVAGVIDEKTLAGDRTPPRRAPWEGFADVGFRTKVAISRR